MAFVKRNKNNGIETVDEVGSEVNTSKNPKNNFIPEKKTFREQAIDVINILESKGIDIYDTNRTPGMYLKGRNSASKNLINFLGGNNTQNQQNQQNQSEEIVKAPDSLIQFFSKK